MIAEIKEANLARSRIDKIVFNWSEAVFVALAVHVAIIFIFRTGTAAPAVKKNGLENVTFLPLAMENKVHGLDDYLFHYSNPETISKPDTKLGYSSVIAANGIREPVPEQARPKLSRNVTVPLNTDIPRIALPTEERSHEDRKSVV